MKMRTYKIIFATLVCLVLAWNVRAYNQGSLPRSANIISDSTIVSKPQLIAPYPNPTSGATTVGFTNSQKVTYSFYVADIHGDTVYTMALNQIADPGSHRFTIPAGTFVPGTYLCSLQIGSMVLRKKLVVVK
jgi:Secretion system C-terminal sorting domain